MAMRMSVGNENAEYNNIEQQLDAIPSYENDLI